jgi:hypothetical protein
VGIATGKDIAMIKLTSTVALGTDVSIGLGPRRANLCRGQRKEHKTAAYAMFAMLRVGHEWRMVWDAHRPGSGGLRIMNTGC